MTSVSIIALCQVVGYLLVLGVQKYFIDKLRETIKDQDNSIKALKTQADGQVSLNTQQQALTEQISKLLTSTLQDSEKRLAIVKETYDYETKNIKQELEQTKILAEKEQAKQLENVADLDVQPEMTELLNSMIRETTSTKTEISRIASLIGVFIKTQSAIGAIQPVSLSSNSLNYSISNSQESHYLARRESKESEVTVIIINFLNSHNIRREEDIDPSTFGLGLALIEACRNAAPELANENHVYFISAVQRMAKSLIGPLALMRERGLHR